MQFRKTLVAGPMALSLVLIGLAALPDTGIADDDDDEKIIVPKGIQKAVNQIADKVAANKDVDQDTAALFKQEDNLKKIMWIFKPRTAKGEGGFGIGPKPGVYAKDGIEVLLNDQASKKPKISLDIKKSADDLTRLADVTLAVADIVYLYRPDKENVGDKEWMVWNDATDGMKKASLDLKVGVKEEDAAAVKRAFLALNFQCTRCHSTFRDGIIVPKQIRDAVNKMADSLAQGKNVNKEAVAFFNAHPGDLKTTMWVFKPREQEGKGGLGVGKPGAYWPDGIEALMLNQIGRKAITLDLKASADDLNRLVDITLAMSEITGQYVPTKTVGEKRPKLWNETNQEMKEAAMTLKAAVKSGNNTEVNQAFKKLAASCNHCHTTFP